MNRRELLKAAVLAPVAAVIPQLPTEATTVEPELGTWSGVKFITAAHQAIKENDRAGVPVDYATPNGLEVEAYTTWHGGELIHAVFVDDKETMLHLRQGEGWSWMGWEYIKHCRLDGRYRLYCRAMNCLRPRHIVT